MITPPFCRYYIIKMFAFQVKYSACAECEMFFCVLEVILENFL